MKVGIVGGGVVGRATARAFLEHVDEVRVWDVVPERRTVNSLGECLHLADLVFVCLPTPGGKDGRLDTSAVTRFFNQAAGQGYGDRNYVLKSTVPIGTTRSLLGRELPNIVHSPEFLTARCADVDAQIPSRLVVGVPVYVTNPCSAALEGLYEQRFPGVQVHVMSSDESEAVKLITNGFFAVKVAFWNEVNQTCAARGLDWDRVLAGVLADGRIAHSHTRVPGPDGKYGFGGTCLPKDLAQLWSELDTGAPSVCGSALVRNKSDRQRGEK